MLLRFLFGTALAIISAGRVHSLLCNEGINVTILGIPLYYWTESECSASAGNSKCFMQDMEVKNPETVIFRYGGCISAAYSSILKCEKLFGSESRMDPSTLINVLSDADDFTNRMVEEFQKNALRRGKMLLSKGQGMDQFIDGIFTFCEILGLKMNEVRKLKQPLTKLMTILFEPMSGVSPSRERSDRFRAAGKEMLDAIGNLGTKEPKISAEIYSFLENLHHGSQILERIKGSKVNRDVIENIPGLYKSMMPSSELAHWIDVAFEMLGKWNMNDLEKSAEDVIKIFEDNVKVPDDVSKFLDTLPSIFYNIAHGSNFMNISLHWGTDLFKAYGVQNKVTTALSDSINDFMNVFNASSPDIRDLISWFPGFFYRFFPTKKAEIDRAYTDLAKDLKSFNFQNIDRTEHLGRTKMSEFLLYFIRSVKPEIKPLDEMFIINFSKMFYNAMTSKYETKLDAFFSSLISGFKTFPQINSGKIIADIIKTLHGEPPPEVKPMLDHLQTAVNALIEENFDDFMTALSNILDAYKTTYPGSKFPPIAKVYLQALKTMVELGSTTPTHCYQHLSGQSTYFSSDGTDFSNFTLCMTAFRRKLKMEALKLLKLTDSADVDFFFAVFQASGFDSDQYLETLDSKAAIVAYVRLIRALDPDDVKELLQDYSTWLSNLFEESDNYQFDNFLFAINATTAKITSKLRDVIKGLRYVHSPETCRYLACSESLCNSHQAIDNVTPVKQNTLRGEEAKSKNNQQPEPTSITPNSAKEIGSNVLLCIAALCVMRKLSLE